MNSPQKVIPGLEFATVRAEDFEEMVSLRIAAMKESLERVGRFDPERARERLRKSFYPEASQFVVIGGVRIGFYTMRLAEDGFHLEHLYVLPDWQSRGVGTEVMRGLLAQADERGAAIYLGALRDSPANRFYLRHGFAQTAEDEWDIYYIRYYVRAPSPLVNPALGATRLA